MNLKFPTQAKNIIFQKSSYRNRPIYIIPEATILYNEFKHKYPSFALVGKANNKD
jgi:hypothetical protein